MKRFKWKLLSIILLVLISYANCENSSPIRQLEPVNKLSSKPSTNTNLHLKHLDTSEEDETSGDTNAADNDDEDEEDTNLDEDEYNGENQNNANDKDEKLDSNTKDDTEDDAEEGEDEGASPVNLSTLNKDKTPLGTFGSNKNEKTDKESSVGGFGSGADDDEEEPDEEADEKEVDEEKETLPDKSKEVSKEELNKNTFNRDKKQPELEKPINNQNNNNLNDKNKSTITDDEEEESEKEDDEAVPAEDSKNKNVQIDKQDSSEKTSKEVGTNVIMDPYEPDIDKPARDLHRSKESNENELNLNNIEGNVSSLGKKDVSKGQISLFAQPLILAGMCFFVVFFVFSFS